MCICFSWQRTAMCYFIWVTQWPSCWNTKRNTLSLGWSAILLNSKRLRLLFFAAKLFHCWCCRRFCFQSAQVRVFVVSAVWRTATTSSSGSITTSGLLLITEPHSLESSGDATDSSARVEVTFLCDSNTVIIHWINGLLNPYIKVHVKNTNA